MAVLLVLPVLFLQFGGQSGSSAFVFDGHVSPVGCDAKVLVKILRDTEAFGSYIVSCVPFFSDTGDHIVMWVMRLDLVPVPVHKLQLDCGLVQGVVEMGVNPVLPIQVVDIILGNDLAGNRVWEDSPPPPAVTSSSSVKEMPGECTQCFYCLCCCTGYVLWAGR